MEPSKGMVIAANQPPIGILKIDENLINSISFFELTEEESLEKCEIFYKFYCDEILSALSLYNTDRKLSCSIIYGLNKKYKNFYAKGLFVNDLDPGRMIRNIIRTKLKNGSLSIDNLLTENVSEYLKLYITQSIDKKLLFVDLVRDIQVFKEIWQMSPKEIKQIISERYTKEIYAMQKTRMW